MLASLWVVFFVSLVYAFYGAGFYCVFVCLGVMATYNGSGMFIC